MSIVPVINAIIKPVPTVDSIWLANRPAGTFDEGTTVQFTIQCLNFIPGQSKLHWGMTGLFGLWEPTWEAAWQAACKGRGMKFTRSGNPYGWSYTGLFEVLQGYNGLPIIMTIKVTENKRTDRPNGVIGQPSNEGQITLRTQIPAGYSGVAGGNGLPFFLRDTSKTPPGTPTYWLKVFGADGVSPVGSPGEGDTFVLKLVTENIVPGTKILVFAANMGQSHLDGGFRPNLKAAAEAVGCACATDYATRGNYNGGVITFLDTYSDANPISVPLKMTEDMQTTGIIRIDFITIFKEEGDPDRPTLVYGGVVSLNIRDTSLAPTPSYWRAHAQRSGGNIVYSISSETGSSDASVMITSYGDEPAAFWTNLAAAAAAVPGLSLDGTVLTSTPEWGGALSWSVPNPGGSGKHGFSLSGAVEPSYIMVGDCVAYFTAPAPPADPHFVTGVNLSGGEFGSTMPGTYGTDYRYPHNPEFNGANIPLRYAQFDYHIDRGARIIRLPVRWERIQEEFYGPLVSDGTLATWSGRLDMDRIDAMVAYANSKGAILLLDVHNYMGRKGLGVVGYDQAVKTDMLVDLWVKLADRYANNPMVWLGIMNEPAGSLVTPERTRDIMEWVMNAIRLRTSSLSRIMVAGTFYTGAWSWVGQGNAAAMEGIQDPAGNFVFEMHQYFDSDSSGTKGICTPGAQSRLSQATSWAREKGYRIFLGEFMGGDPNISGQEQCGAVVPAACNYMAANQDVWCGWTAWGGGSRWGVDYIFRLDPKASYITPVDTAQFDMIEPYYTVVA